MTEESVLLAHIGRTNDVTAGYVEGTQVTALCGASIVPSRDPDRLADCEDCVRIFDLIRAATEWRSAMDLDELLATTCEVCGAPLLPGLEFCIGCDRPVSRED